MKCLEELLEVKNLIGSVISYEYNSQNIFVRMTKDEKHIEIRFFVNEYYPINAPSIKVMNCYDADIASKIQSRMNEFFLHSKLNKLFYVSLIDIYTTIWPVMEPKNWSSNSITNSYEINKLLAQNSIRSELRDGWIAQRLKSHHNGDQMQKDIVIDQFLVYLLYILTHNSCDLSECAHLLEYSFKLINPPSYQIHKIPITIREVIESSPYAFPSIKGVLLSQSQMIPYGNQPITKSIRILTDFCVLHVWRDGLVRAHNKVDGRSYTVQCIVLNNKEESDKTSGFFSSLKNLIFRYIARYYDSWIQEYDQESAMIIDQVFQISSSNIWGYLFVQWDDLKGHSLDEIYRTKQFFIDSKRQWGISREILELLNYIDLSNITLFRFVHPCNIFIQTNGEILFGAFEYPKDEFFDLLSDPYRKDLSSPDSKSVIFAYGIIFFQIWFPFSSSQERINTISSIIDSKILPKDWCEAFPMQSKVMSLILQDPVKRITASDLMNTQLVQSSDGDQSKSQKVLRMISNDKNAVTPLLNAFFSKSRRPPFRIHDSSQRYSFSMKNGYLLSKMRELFAKYAIANDAKYIEVPVITNLNDSSSNEIPLMSANGQVFCLNSIPMKSISRILNEKNIKSGKFFAFFNQYSDTKGRYIEESEALVYFIVHATFSHIPICNCLTFVANFIHELFPFLNCPIKAEILTSAISSDILSLFEKRSGFSATDFVDFVKKSKSHSNPMIKILMMIISMSSNRIEWKLSYSVDSTNQSLMSIRIHLEQPLGEIITYQNRYASSVSDSPFITRCRMHVSQFFRICDPFLLTKKNYILYMIITSNKWSINAEEKDVLSNEDWNRSYICLAPLMASLRSKSIGVFIANNDSYSISHHRTQADSLDYFAYAVSSVDSSDQSTTKIIVFSRRFDQAWVEKIKSINIKKVNISIDFETEE